MSFDQTKAGDNNVDWTSLIAGPTLAIQDTYLQQDITSGYVPYAPTLGTYVTADQAKAAYTSLEAFYKANGHLWVGTGPYYISKVDTTAGSITTTKFADYMYADDQYTTAYSAPRIAVAAVSADSPTQVTAGQEAKFTVDVTFDNKPYPSTDIQNVSYTLFGSDGSEVASGDATMSAEGQYVIDLTTDVTGKMTAGSATLSIAVASKVVAMPTFVSYQFVVTA
jgi:peptide/nickel transport system substrate-binding protein